MICRGALGLIPLDLPLAGGSPGSPALSECHFVSCPDMQALPVGNFHFSRDHISGCNIPVGMHAMKEKQVAL